RGDRLMSRARSAISAVNRRYFLAATGAVGASAGLGLTFGAGGGSGRAAAAGPSPPPQASSPHASAPPAPPAASPALDRTTIDSVATGHAAGDGYQRLGDGPGWRRVVREDLAAARYTRTAQRFGLT